MARIDKYNPVSGGFRARLGFAPVAGEVGDVIAVGLNASGQVIKAAAAADCVGVICLSSLLAQGDVVDVMTDGEIVDVVNTTDNVTGAAAGALAFAVAGGAVGATASAVRVGHYVEAWRLIVRVQVV